MKLRQYLGAIMPKLTDKKEAFCQEYLIDLNQTQAAIRSGFSEKTASSQASRLLTNVNIQERIAELQAERSKRTQVDADYVLNGLMKLNSICMGDKEVTITDSDGALTTTKVFEQAGANKSFELIGRHLKMFTDKVSLESQEGITFNLNFGCEDD